jgi:hypothetical protein
MPFAKTKVLYSKGDIFILLKRGTFLLCYDISPISSLHSQTVLLDYLRREKISVLLQGSNCSGSQVEDQW